LADILAGLVPLLLKRLVLAVAVVLCQQTRVLALIKAGLVAVRADMSIALKQLVLAMQVAVLLEHKAAARQAGLVL
jgi:hypothetical protein